MRYSSGEGANNLINANLTASAKISLYRTYVALMILIPRDLWICVSLQCGHAIKTKLNAFKHTRQTM